MFFLVFAQVDDRDLRANAVQTAGEFCSKTWSAPLMTIALSY
nr:MAG TPA: hypothetical protein [Caudoviricetes sp.]